MKDGIEKAALWLTTLPPAQRPHPIIPAIRDRFDLSATDAVEAIQRSNLIKARAI